jgi:hypothetical protein
MTTFHWFGFACLFLLLHSSVIHADWAQKNGPIGRMAGAFAMKGSNLFVGGMGGVYLSTDNGSSWTEVNKGLTDKIVMTLAVSGSYVFAATYSGVFRSANNGDHWSPVNTGLTNLFIWAFQLICLLILKRNNLSWEAL